MDTGIYVALSKEIGILRDMEVTSNDLANMTTTGYNGSSLLFKTFLAPGTVKEGKVAYANDAATFRSTEQGVLQTTGAPLDAAIEGAGYFVVQTPLGIRYTRNGNFKTNPIGTLVTSEGYPVLDESNQSITFDETDKIIRIGDNGTINVDGSERATLKIVQFDNEQLLERAGNTMYKSDAKPKAAENIIVANGMLEMSNVKPVLALTHMLYVSRSIAETTNYISTVDGLSRKASDTLAKVYS
jgi:flagellar basal-body rod protein FlgF